MRCCCRRDSVMVANSRIIFGDRIVIPELLGHKVLKQFYKYHPGTNTTTSLARSYAYWSSLDKDIENKCRNCPSCLQAAKNPGRDFVKLLMVQSKVKCF